MGFGIIPPGISKSRRELASPPPLAAEVALAEFGRVTGRRSRKHPTSAGGTGRGHGIKTHVFDSPPPHPSSASGGYRRASKRRPRRGCAPLSPPCNGRRPPHDEGAEEGATRARAAEISRLATRPRRAGAAAGEIKSTLADASQSQLICCQPRA